MFLGFVLSEALALIGLVAPFIYSSTDVPTAHLTKGSMMTLPRTRGRGSAEPAPPARSPELVIGCIAFLIVFVRRSASSCPEHPEDAGRADRSDRGRHERAEEAQAEAQQAARAVREQLAEARHEAARLREEAREQGAQIIAEMREEARPRRERIIAAGHAQIEADRSRPLAALRPDVGKLATDLAGRIVGESLEDEARQSRTVDRFLDELERRREARGRRPMSGASRRPALAAVASGFDALTDGTSGRPRHARRRAVRRRRRCSTASSGCAGP